MQLEDDAHLDPRLAQPLGLALHVGHVDVGDAARLVRLALGERDLHPAVREPRPAVVEVDEDLLEAEHVAVEGARRVEVAHPVPDRRHV